MSSIPPNRTERCGVCGEEALLSELNMLARIWHCVTCGAYRPLTEDVPTPPASRGPSPEGPPESVE